MERENASWGDEGIRVKRREEETDREGIERHEREGEQRDHKDGKRSQVPSQPKDKSSSWLISLTHCAVLSVPSFLVMYVMCDGGADINVV